MATRKRIEQGEGFHYEYVLDNTDGMYDTDAPRIVTEIKDTLMAIAAENNTHNMLADEAYFRLTDMDVQVLINNPLWLSELDSVQYSYCMVPRRGNEEPGILVYYSKEGFADPYDSRNMRIYRVILAKLGLPLSEIDNLKLAWDVEIHTPEGFISRAWHYAWEYFYDIPAVRKEYNEAKNPIWYEELKSITPEMLEEYWFERYGVKDIEELRTDINRLKLRGNDSIVSTCGFQYIVKWQENRYCEPMSM